MVTIRKGCPLMLAGPNRYVFLHASLIEYFATKSLYEKMKVQHEEEAQRKEREKKEEKKAEQKEPAKVVVPVESKITPPVALSEIEMLSERLLNGENNLLQFLSDRVNQDPDFKAQLFAFIEASKQDKRYAIASANAATILNKANVNFSELNWEGVCIAGADLSGGVLDSMNLRDADLTNVHLQGAWLRQNDLTGAIMKEIQFGEYPGLTLDSTIWSCAYSPDGHLFAVGCFNNNIYLYDTRTRLLQGTLKGHKGYVISVAFSPSGREVASGSWDYTLRLWDVATGECLRQMEGHTSYVTSVTFNLSGAYVISGSHDQTVRIWNAKTGECCAVVKGFPNRVSTVQWHRTVSGEEYLVTGCDDNGVRLFKLMIQGQGPHQTFRTVLCWTSQTGTLVATDTCLANAIGLSTNNGDLLKQRGAVGEFKVAKQKDQLPTISSRASSSLPTPSLTTVGFYKKASSQTNEMKDEKTPSNELEVEAMDQILQKEAAEKYNSVLMFGGRAKYLAISDALKRMKKYCIDNQIKKMDVNEYLAKSLDGKLSIKDAFEKPRKGGKNTEIINTIVKLLLTQLSNKKNKQPHI